MRPHLDTQQPELFDPQPPIIWPDPARFPHNRIGTSVDAIVGSDLRASPSPLVITSYTSLDRIISLLADFELKRSKDPAVPQEARIVIGHEPSRTRRKDFRDGRQRFEQEITNYWLKQGISIARSAHVLAAMQCLARESIHVRTSGDRVIHAKIYITESAATLGSSNYSISGMLKQAEANCRFSSDADPERYDECTQLAQAIWHEAADYKSGLLALLRRLLQQVDWQEALGRACAELLEGRWAGEILGDATTPALWPAQRAGIAQALWILDSAGSVLIADATGSGKTRMGAQLLAAIKMRRIRTGVARLDPVALISPPAVAAEWRTESLKCGHHIEPYSHGVLSNRNAGARVHTLQAVRRASVLAVDEAHHYLNRAAARTQVLYRNFADHVVLFTATPINRGAQDLLAIVDLLGADSFEDEVVTTVERAWRRVRSPRHLLSNLEQEQIRAAIQRFTVRRTKTMLNALVDHDPDAYRDEVGRICKYPGQTPQRYACYGNLEDRRLAEAIRSEASQLRGLTYLRTGLKLPALLKSQGVTPEKYLQQRLNGAAGLARYNVSAGLRSSRAALLEHLCGTEYACAHFNLRSTVKGAGTGDVIGKLKRIAGHPPKSHLGVPLPDFLTSPDAHSEACREEAGRYRRIQELLSRMSSEREDAKAGLLATQMQNHKRILAFDSFLITLHDMKQRLSGVEHAVLIATGESKRDRAAVLRVFARNSTETAIGLCSDALAEGVNLQGASAVVLLDMPSVIRVAEQRIGRIDRMNSPYEQIEVFWPEDSPEFAVRSDELFLSRVRTVADLIGSNIHLPPSMQFVDGEEHVVSVERMQELIAASQHDPSDIRDAFHAVRELVEGAHRLVPEATYGSVRNTDVRIHTAIGVVRASERWGFYAVRGSDREAPRWVYLDRNSDPVSDLDLVAKKLRERLRPDTPNRLLDHAAASAMAEDAAILQTWEEKLLPTRKRKALELLRTVVKTYLKSGDTPDPHRSGVLRQFDRLLHNKRTAPKWASADQDSAEDVVSYSFIADWWIDLVRPVWERHLSDPTRKRAARLKDIRKALVAEPLPTSAFESLLETGDKLWTQPIAHRVVATIVGIPDPENPEGVSEMPATPPARRASTGGRS